MIGDDRYNDDLGLGGYNSEQEDALGVIDPMTAATIISAGVNIFSKLFGGEGKTQKIPQMQIGFKGTPPDMKYGGTHLLANGWWFAVGGGAEGLPANFPDQALQPFVNAWQKLPADKQQIPWQSNVLSLSGMSGSGLTQQFTAMLESYLSAMGTSSSALSSSSSPALASMFGNIPVWAWAVGGVIIIFSLVGGRR